MYVPKANVMADPGVAAFLSAHPAARLVTVGPDGRPDSTLLPVIVDGDRVLGHLARANEHWTRIAPASPALLIVSGADAYVSPAWYASKAEHGRVVPTWNYSEVQLRGAVTVHDDPDWVLDVVTRLTGRHEAGRDRPWAVTDAPAKYVRGRLRAIVGIEVSVESVEGKAKLSQNRSDADREGAIAGMRDEGDAPARVVADEMERALRD
ncbi:MULTISPECIES: FMN-binding negative transcriptional regulator [unclassified Terrabacter]|uniref:FMN-binding negative transcriptional regulator n=1 Tax=unclassified Terrabacter TaxID=2630222 RepID=UPI0006F77D65|nr:MULTISPECIES: FMN-binding negative transcriptional regulator [unclassified Terrabacter]KRB47371.1 transcriptional regulator [Terrabacter sp. Root181]KRF35723.1 transcriptional regulator [Terrabacter sp. Soil810]